MDIRPEIPADAATISRVITSAFLEAEHSGGNEAAIVDGLRDAGSLSLSLVATEADRIVGHVAFSPVTVDGANEGWFGLGPVAVAPDRQGHGVGSALIEAGLDQLRARGARGCVVLGEPGYYGRFGFVQDPGLALAGVPPAYFQALVLMAPPCAGRVEYHPAFDVG